jgi:hypothetical protein
MENENRCSNHIDDLRDRDTVESVAVVNEQGILAAGDGAAGNPSRILVDQLELPVLAFRPIPLRQFMEMVALATMSDVE